MKVRQTKKELENHFKEQLGFLKLSCDSYDQGNHAEGKRIATTLRTLLYDTIKSKSLAKHLQIKNKEFLSTRSQFSEDPKHNISQMGLINVFIGDGSETFDVPLDEAMEKNDLQFEEWWEECIIIDTERNRFSRKDIVLDITNKDGGAHVDEHLKSEYSNLSRNNSLGVIKKKGSDWVPLKTPELATVRQIGHEVLKTFIQGYSKQPARKGDGIIVGGMEIITSKTQTKTKEKKIGRNDRCSCGSGLKYKKCCGSFKKN